MKTLEQLQSLSDEWSKYENAIGSKCVFRGQYTGWGYVEEWETDGVLYHIDKESDYPFEDVYGNQFKYCKLLNEGEK